MPTEPHRPYRKLPYARTKLRRIAKLALEIVDLNQTGSRARAGEIRALAEGLEELLHNRFRRPNRPLANLTSVKMTPFVRERIVEMDAKGYPALEIALELRVDRSRVSEVLRQEDERR